MSLDVERLEKVKHLAGGITQSRCPACAEAGHDRTGEHLRIWPDGRYGCVLNPGDKSHRRRIWELAHGATRRRVPIPAAQPVIRPDFSAHIRAWSETTKPAQLIAQASLLGVTAWSLWSLGWCWSESHGAWAIPMFDAAGAVVGIRLRWSDGRKRSVTGSMNGLFLSSSPAQVRLWICEGPTSTAAALSLGFWAVGRPNCSARGPMLVDWMSRHKVREAVVWCDNDPAGLAGAQELDLQCRWTILVSACKDPREFIQIGGTRQTVEDQLIDTVWRQPT